MKSQFPIDALIHIAFISIAAALTVGLFIIVTLLLTRQGAY